MNAKDLYSVKVSVGGAALNLQDVNTINILSPDCNFANRTRRYKNLNDLAADMIGGASSFTYSLAKIIKNQNTACKEILITQVGANRCILFAGTMTAGSIVVSVNGQVFTQAFATDKATTINALATQLETAGFETVVTSSGNNTALILGRNGITYIAAVTATIGGSDTLQAGVVQFGYLLENNGTMTAGAIHFQINGIGDTDGPTSGKNAITGKKYYETPFTTSKATTLGNFADDLVTKSEGAIVLASYTADDKLVWIADIGENVYIDILQIERPSGSTDTLTIAEGYYFDATAATLTGEDLITALNAGVTEDGSWLIMLDCCGGSDHAKVIAGQKLLADWCEADKESVYIAVTQASSAYTTADETTSVLGYCSTFEYQCSAVLVTRQFNRYHECNVSYAGKIAPLKPGAFDTYALPLKGVEPDYFTASEQAIIKAKNGEFLSEYRDFRTGTSYKAVTNVGKATDGEWLAIAIGAMWIKSLVLYTCAGNQLVLNNLGQKLPYSKKGFAIQESWIRSAMQQALPSSGYAGLLTDQESDALGNVIGGFYVTYPDITTIPDATKAAGTLEGVSVQGFLSGAIRHTTINIGLDY